MEQSINLSNIYIYVRMEWFNDRTPQCTRDAYVVLWVKIFLIFEKSLQRVVYYQVENISYLYGSVRYKSHPTDPVRNFHRKSPNIFLCGFCEVLCVYEYQCVISLTENGGNFVMSQFDRWNLRWDGVYSLWL